MTASPAYKQFTVGRVLDVGTRLYVLLWPTLLLVTVVIYIPALVLHFAIIAAAPSGLAAELAFVFILPGAVLSLADVLATAVVAASIQGILSGGSSSSLGGLSSLLTRLRPLFWLASIRFVLLVIALSALVVPYLYLVMAWAVAVPALVMEDVRGRCALHRSRALVRGRWWLVFIAIGTVRIVSFVMQGVVGVSLTDDIGLSETTSFYAVTFASHALTALFVATVSMVLFLRLRMEKDGLCINGEVHDDSEPHTGKLGCSLFLPRTDRSHTHATIFASICILVLLFVFDKQKFFETVFDVFFQR